MFRKIIILIVVVVASYFIFSDRNNKSADTESESNQIAGVNFGENEYDKHKTFIFESWHGSTDVSDKFRFQYPADWFNEGQYFSPQKIQFYTKYEAKAPIWFDLVLAEIFDYAELKYKIDNSQRIEPDTTGQIGGREFKRYFLVDYGTYGGESAGRVKIFVGPTIKIDGTDYILVFHWEERPLAQYMPGNNVDVFDNILLTLEFFE